ncbi:HD domain-containing protein [Candidatus Woesearchaeota archaeon]|nr:HD domain-containing protein [Candidatus Woesearchaeota archaeon]
MGYNLSWGSDLSAEDPVLNHPVMRYQQGHAQLCQIQNIYSGANHTRFHHSGYAALIARRISEHLERIERLEGSKKDIITATKIHDIGHPPFSHAAEYVLSQYCRGLTHNERALKLLDSDEKDQEGRTCCEVLEWLKISVPNLRKLLSKKDASAKIFTDKTLGADKLAYTLMDAVQVGFDQLPPDWQQLIPHLTFFDGELGLDCAREQSHFENQVGMIYAIQQFYFRMYTEVYLSPLSLAYERHLQKALDLSLRAGILDPFQVWNMADQVLLDRINNSVSGKSKGELNEKAKEVLNGYDKRCPFLPAVAFKYEQFKHNHLKGEAVAPLDEDLKTKFLAAFQNPLLLTDLETELSTELGSPILISVLPDPEKVKPTDVALYSGSRRVDSIKNQRPDHFSALEGLTRSFFAIRVLCPANQQEQISRQHQKVAEILRTATEKHTKNH